MTAFLQAALDHHRNLDYLIILSLAQLGLRSCELVGQDPNIAYCRCFLCDALRTKPTERLEALKISPETADYIRDYVQKWSVESKRKPTRARRIRLDLRSRTIIFTKVATLDDPIPLPPNFLPVLRSFVSIAHHRDPLPGLRVKDIDFGTNHATVYGKGTSSNRSEVRMARLTRHMAEVMHTYIDAKKLKNDDRLVPLTTRRIRQIVKEVAVLANYPQAQHVHPHTFRHFFVTEIEKKHGLVVAKDVVGHSDVSTTQRYADVADDRKDEAVDDTFERGGDDE